MAVGVLAVIPILNTLLLLLPCSQVALGVSRAVMDE